MIAVAFVGCLLATGILPFFEPQVGESEKLLPVNASDFFRFPKPQKADKVYVVECDGLSRSDKFTMVSLQGLVNRQNAELYLDFDTPETVNYSWREANLRGIPNEVLTFGEAMEKFRSRSRGLVVYEEAHQDTINLATTLAGLEDLLICNSTRIEALNATYGLGIVEDLTTGEWAQITDSPQFYLKAFARYYPKCDQSAMAMLNPYLLTSRDWVVARKLFCYFLSPGPLAAPGQAEAFVRILHDSPNTTCLIGWMRADLGIEENSGMQAISKAGKMLLPCEDTPDLSFTGSLRMSGPSRSVIEPEERPKLENKTYISFLISDGDNTDYVCHYMRQRWAAPERGTVPVGWSLPPALAEAAPSMLEYYYRTATSNDTFLAGSSGAAIMYPDFYPPSRLPLFLNRTRQLMDISGLKSVWLINSYTAHETAYSERSLSTYVDYLYPSGIFLDYGDVPVSRPYWVQNGNVKGGVPVVRSLHMWGSRENLVAKVLLDAEKHPAGPYFIFVTVHVWTMGLPDVVDVVRQLGTSPQGPQIKVVAPATLLQLIQADTLRKASASLDELKADPFTSFMAGGETGALDVRMGEARRAVADGNYFWGAAIASDVNSRTENLLADRDTAIFALIVVLIMAILIVVLFVFRRGRETWHPARYSGWPSMALAMAATFVFFLSMFGVLFSYMWDWLAFAAIIPAAVAALPFAGAGRVRKLPEGTRIIAASAVICAGAAVQSLTVWAAAPVAFGFVWLMGELSGRLGSGERAYALVICFAVSCALLNAVEIRPLVTGLSVLWVLFLSGWTASRSSSGPMKAGPEHTRDALRDNYPLWMPAAFLALNTVSLYLTRKHYLMLTFGSVPAFLIDLSIMIPLGSLAIALPLSRILHNADLKLMQPVLIVTFGLGWLGVAFISHPLASSMLILLAQTSMLILAILAFGRFMGGPAGEVRFPPAVRSVVLLFILANFLLLLPVIVYNLYLGKLPLSLNYLMYNFPLEFALFTFAGILPFTLAAYYFHRRGMSEKG
jgi:hypothetical protein